MTNDRLNPRARRVQLDKSARQSQLYDDHAVKPCQHMMLCGRHRRCISSRLKKVCPYRCQVCAPREAQHA